MSESRADVLAREEKAFQAQRDGLLAEYEGQYVVFKDGHPVKFFADLTGAYGFALLEYGLDIPCLIERVIRHPPDVASLSWETGVLCVQG
jgi:hypothetical protein